MGKTYSFRDTHLSRPSRESIHEIASPSKIASPTARRRVHKQAVPSFETECWRLLSPTLQPRDRIHPFNPPHTQTPECSTNPYPHESTSLLTQKLPPQDDNYYGRRERRTRCHSQEPETERQIHRKRRRCSLVTRHALPQKPPTPGDNTKKESSPRTPTTENQSQDLPRSRRIRTKPRNGTQSGQSKYLTEKRRNGSMPGTLYNGRLGAYIRLRYNGPNVLKQIEKKTNQAK
ncbi:hypothetical protein YC2023_075108 [Brassica napus]